MLSHLDDQGRPRIVDVGGKEVTRRVARARATVYLPADVRAQFVDGDLQTKKGPVFNTATIAGIMGAKKTSELIPLCHPIGMDNCTIDITMSESGEVVIDCTATVTHRTGVEMEALTGASIAALTIYDMCKGLSHDIVIRDVKLMEKRGGKRDYRMQE
jgi:cyclic pyranopterin monophosphate synthase